LNLPTFSVSVRSWIQAAIGHLPDGHTFVKKFVCAAGGTFSTPPQDAQKTIPFELELEWGRKDTGACGFLKRTGVGCPFPFHRTCIDPPLHPAMQARNRNLQERGFYGFKRKEAFAPKRHYAISTSNYKSYFGVNQKDHQA